MGQSTPINGDSSILEQETAAAKEHEGRTITDLNTTLGDLGERDRDNFAHVMKRDAKVYKLPDHQAGIAFMGQAVDKALKRLGVFMRENMRQGETDYLLAKMKIKIEHRPYGPDEKVYQSGLFIYKDNEIAYYISSPYRQESSLDLGPAVYIRTTVPGML